MQGNSSHPIREGELFARDEPALGDGCSLAMLMPGAVSDIQVDTEPDGVIAGVMHIVYGNPTTGVGTHCCVLVPFPNCPQELSPQHRRPPEDERAHVCS